MLCFFIYQIDMATVLILLPYIIAVVGTIVSIIAVRQSKNKIQAEQTEKLASKEYVKQSIEPMSTQIKAIDKRITENEMHNNREHDAIKAEFLSKVNMIFEWIKEKSK